MTVTKTKMIDLIQQRLTLTRKQSDKIVEAFFEIIETSLISGKDVMISGFGDFTLRRTREQENRDPAKDERPPSTSERTVTFQCSPRLREKLNRRSEARLPVDQFSSVELFIPNFAPVSYEFKIRNISPAGVGFLLNENSRIAKCLQVGEVIDMKYKSLGSPDQTQRLKTEIKHITRDELGRFKGHYLVGLSILTD